jgi:hypothetical protein
LERRRWCLLLDSYVIVESEKGSALLDALGCYARDYRTKRRLIHDFARSIGQLHACDLGIRHFAGREVIVSRKNSSFAFSLVDFTDLISSPLSQRSRIQHLYGLAGTVRGDKGISKTDRLRFLRSYLGSDFEREWKTFVRGFRA